MCWAMRIDGRHWANLAILRHCLQQLSRKWSLLLSGCVREPRVALRPQHKQQCCKPPESPKGETRIPAQPDFRKFASPTPRQLAAAMGQAVGRGFRPGTPSAGSRRPQLRPGHRTPYEVFGPSVAFERCRRIQGSWLTRFDQQSAPFGGLA